jgi:hypothetical protein
MVNLTYNKNRPLPSAEELPSSDETPVDNQLQNDIPNLLLSLLALIWSGRDDWEQVKAEEQINYLTKASIGYGIEKRVGKRQK